MTTRTPLHEAACLAYGWLWLASTTDPRIHKAREALLSQLSRADMSHGIAAAKAAGGEVDGAAIEYHLNRGMT